MMKLINRIMIILGDGNKQQYEPDSDMDFVEFRERMKKEWANRKFK